MIGDRSRGPETRRPCRNRYINIETNPPVSAPTFPQVTPKQSPLHAVFLSLSLSFSLSFFFLLSHYLHPANSPQGARDALSAGC